MNHIETIENKRKELDAIVARQWGQDKIPSFKLDLSKESVRWLGRVSYGHSKQSTMQLQKGLLEQLGQKYIDEVFVHEYAHLVVRALYPSGMNGYKRVNAHGREFKAVCSWFGIKGKATTSIANGIMPKSNRRTTRVIPAKCSCMTHMITNGMRNKIIMGESRICSKCRTRLTV